jgi:hypothetical protein
MFTIIAQIPQFDEIVARLTIARITNTSLDSLSLIHPQEFDSRDPSLLTAAISLSKNANCRPLSHVRLPGEMAGFALYPPKTDGVTRGYVSLVLL